MHCSSLIRNPPSQQEYEPEPPLGAPPPYRLPPQPGVNVSSPHGNNQYYPGSAQGDWRLGAFVSKIFWFDNCKKSRVENRFDKFPGGMICTHPNRKCFVFFSNKMNNSFDMISHWTVHPANDILIINKLFNTFSITFCNISFIPEHWHITINYCC